jgi:cytochrome c-type biogenesis protein CcmE
MDLKSTVNKMGKQTQVFHFEGNVKLTYEGLLPETLKEGKFTKIMCSDGRMLMINPDKLLLVEIFSEDEV